MVVMEASLEVMGVVELGRRLVMFMSLGSRPPGPEPELLPVLKVGLVGLASALVGVVLPEPAGDFVCDISDGRPRAPGVCRVGPPGTAAPSAVTVSGRSLSACAGGSES